jgi:hypothetical protein
MTASAQEARHFYLTSPLTLNVVREKQMPVGRDRLDDVVGIVTFPELSVGAVLPRTKVALSYYPEFEIFTKYGELNTVNHTAGFNLTHKINPQWTFAAKDSFLHTQDPSRTVRDSIFLLPRSRFRENIFGLSLDYRPSSRTTVTLGFDNTISYLSLPDFFRYNRFNQMVATGTGSLSHMLTRQQRLTGSYSLLALRDLNEDKRLPGDPSLFRWAHNFNLTDRFGSEAGFFFEPSVGVFRSGFTSYTVAGRIGRVWRSFLVDAGYSRQLALLRGVGAPEGVSTLGSGLDTGSVSQVASLKLAGTVGRRLGMELRAAAGKNSEALVNQDIKSFTGRLRLVYRFGESVCPFIGAEYYRQNVNELVPIPLARKRFFVGIAILLSRPPEDLPATQPEFLEGTWSAGIPGLITRTRPKNAGAEGEEQ